MPETCPTHQNKEEESMYMTTRFREHVLSDNANTLQLRHAAFALMPESVALPWIDGSTTRTPTRTQTPTTEPVTLPDGGTIQFLRHRGLGRGFIARTYRSIGGGYSAQETRYILLAEAGDVAVLIEWPRGHAIGTELAAVRMDGTAVDLNRLAIADATAHA